jgi:REP element-mobilizing transposase RayT
MPHSFTHLVYHIVFATKRRQPWLAPHLRPKVWAFLGSVVKSLENTPLCINGVEDHVHLLLRMRPDQALADTVRTLKAHSSGWLHRTVPESQDFAWQTGYAAFTVSKTQLTRVHRYIENQEEHHRQVPFEQEWKSYLRAHGIELTDEELWE